MNEEKGFSLLLKIIIIILLVFVLVAIIIYSRKLDDQPLTETSGVEQTQNQKEVVSYDELVNNYQESLIKVIDEFNGDYQILQENIVEIAVPSGFQELHLQLVLALNPALYEDSLSITKSKLQKIADDNEWLEKSLNKIILNII